MRVSKWGNSLAVRLPKRVVDDLGLRVGDELSLVQALGRTIEFEARDRRAQPGGRPDGSGDGVPRPVRAQRGRPGRPRTRS